MALDDAYLVSDKVRDKHATLTFIPLHKERIGHVVSLRSDQYYLRWYCFFFVCWLDITGAALQCSCSLNECRSTGQILNGVLFLALQQAIREY